VNATNNNVRSIAWSETWLMELTSNLYMYFRNLDSDEAGRTLDEAGRTLTGWALAGDMPIG